MSDYVPLNGPAGMAGLIDDEGEGDWPLELDLGSQLRLLQVAVVLLGVGVGVSVWNCVRDTHLGQRHPQVRTLKISLIHSCLGLEVSLVSRNLYLYSDNFARL